MAKTETGVGGLNIETLLLFNKWRESGLSSKGVEEARSRLSLLRETGDRLAADASTIEDATLLLSELREILLSIGL